MFGMGAPCRPTERCEDGRAARAVQLVLAWPDVVVVVGGSVGG